VPLPDAQARRTILEIFITRPGHKSQLTIDELAERTQGYSGREIEQVCQTAVTHMTQRANPGLLAIVDKGQDAVRDYEIRVEALSPQDFEIAFTEIKPGSDSAMLRRYEAWSKQVDE